MRLRASPSAASSRTTSTCLNLGNIQAPRSGEFSVDDDNDRPSGDTTAPAAWFAYSPDRKGENPRQHLKLYKGALQADAYAGFQQLYESGTIVEVACWAHTRRKFHEIHIAHASTTTTEAIERIAALYAIEAEIRGSTPEVRKAIRQARARPLLDTMKAWLEATLAKLSRKADTAAAIRYALSRWPALTRYVDDGHLEIDNNAAERALRVVALGRKNYLFAGSNAGGERAAAIYSLLGSAKPNGLDPELYLHHVLDRIADYPISRNQRPAAMERLAREPDRTRLVMYPHNAMWIRNSDTLTEQRPRPNAYTAQARAMALFFMALSLSSGVRRPYRRLPHSLHCLEHF
jgi:hypothetical protein